MKNTHKRSLGGLALACLGLATVLGLSACGGGGGGGGGQQGAPSAATTTPPADTRETSVTPSNTVRWQGGGFDGIALAGITQSSDGGVWALGAEGGCMVSRSFARSGLEPCGADGQRFRPSSPRGSNGAKAPRRSPRFGGASMRPSWVPAGCTWRGSTKRHVGSTPALRIEGYLAFQCLAGHGDQHHRATRQSRRRTGSCQHPWPDALASLHG